MNIVADPGALAERRVVLCIGNFDGVHLGHRRLLARMKERSGAADLPSVVLTFFPPARVLFGQAQYLTSAAEKLALLSSFRPTAAVLIPFDHEYAQTDSGDFLASVASLEPDTVIVGENFRFGHGRAGSIADLASVSDKLEVFNLQRLGGDVISSSRIRGLLQQGGVEQARTLLGAPYSVRGAVVVGEKRGRTIGFPTANIDVPQRKALPLGVFAVSVTTDSGRYGGMANVGPRPSFPDAPPSLEVHLFDVEEDLYGHEITVEFIGFIRHQVTFNGIEALKRQLGEDAEFSRALLVADSGVD